MTTPGTRNQRSWWRNLSTQLSTMFTKEQTCVNFTYDKNGAALSHCMFARKRYVIISSLPFLEFLSEYSYSNLFNMCYFFSLIIILLLKRLTTWSILSLLSIYFRKFLRCYFFFYWLNVGIFLYSFVFHNFNWDNDSIHNNMVVSIITFVLLKLN